MDAKSRITAFVVNANGEPSLECWDISSMSDSTRVQRNDGSHATSHALSLSKNNDLEGVDVLTWPSYATIWPPPEGSVHSEHFDLSMSFKYVTLELCHQSFHLSASLHKC